jgi:hypothetical protein
MGQIRSFVVMLAAIAVLGCAGCASTKVASNAKLVGFESSDRDITAALEAPNLAIRQMGYATPGNAMTLPSKKIRIFVPSTLSPMGRLIGEHFVWATIQPETFWTPSTSGVDVIMPDDVYIPKNNQTPPAEDRTEPNYASGSTSQEHSPAGSILGSRGN